MDYLLIWVLAGRGYAEAEGARVEARSGDLLSFRPRRAHAYGAVPSDPWEILWVHYRGRLAAGFAAAIRGGDGVRAILGLDAELRERWHALAMTYATRGGHSDLRRDTALCALLGQVAERRERMRQRRGGAPPALDAAALQAFVHTHLAEALPLARLAREAGRSVPHFVRLFRRQFGVSPIRYVNQTRVGRAATLLEETTLPVKAVAAAVGTEDPLYFSRQFRRATGLSPRAYRERAQRGVRRSAR